MISGVGLASARMSGLRAIALDHVGLQHAAADRPRKISAPPITSERARVGLLRIDAPSSGPSASVRPVVDHALDVADEDVLALHAQRDQQVEAGERRGAGARRRRS
jgi:hypothetical protein